MSETAKWGFQVEIEERTEHGGRRKVWKWVRPTNGEPYRYDSEQEARRMCDISYPRVSGANTRVRQFDR